MLKSAKTPSVQRGRMNTRDPVGLTDVQGSEDTRKLTIDKVGMVGLLL